MAVYRTGGSIARRAAAAAASLKERLAQAAEHLEMLSAYKNEVVAVKEMRRHISAYLKACRMQRNSEDAFIS